MKSASVLSRLVLSSGVLAVTACTSVRATNDATQGAPDLAQAITQAPDPSAAIQAYARAAAAAPSDLSVEAAYLHRMVSFGLPEMADAQAVDLTRRVPADGEAWAVVAYMTTKRSQGGMGTALGLVDAQAAVQYAPDDPFVLRTAAQLVAWYDVRADKSQTNAEERNAAEDLRRKLANNAVYAEAYARTSAAYLKMASASPSAQPAAPAAAQIGAQVAAPPYAPLVQPAPDQYDAYGAYGGVAAQVPYYYPEYVPYPEPYAIAPYDSYWYPSAYVGTDWWWPGFFGGIVIDDDFRHYRDFDRDDRGRDRDSRGGDRDDHAWTTDRSGRGAGTGVPHVTPPSSGGGTVRVAPSVPPKVSVQAASPTWNVPRSYSAPPSIVRSAPPAPAHVSVAPSGGSHLSVPMMGGGGAPGHIGGGGGGGFGGGVAHVGGGFAGGGGGGGGAAHVGGGGGRR